MSQPVSIFRNSPPSDQPLDDSGSAATARMPARSVTPIARFDYLDGIRALAACYVVLSHHLLDMYNSLSPAMQKLTFWFQFGHYAVDVFIVLSGYCLMLPVARNAATGSPLELRGGMGEYFRRRSLRILPPYFASVLLSILVLLCIGESAQVTFAGVLSHLLLIHNFSPRWVWAINPPLWSVAVEWQIYFAFPLLLLPVRIRFGKLACVAVAMIGGLIPQFLLPQHWNLVWSYPWYLGLFSLGMVTAEFTYASINRNEILIQRILAGFSVLCFAAVIVSTRTNSALYLHPYMVDTMMGAAAALGIAWASRHRTINHDAPLIIRLLSVKPLLWIGAFSYSIYLIHVPVWVAIEPLIRKMHLSPSVELAARFFIGVPVVIAASKLFYLIIEKPTMRMRSSKAFSSPMVKSGPRQPMTLFVQRASECLTDYFPNGDGLICYSLLSGLAERGHQIFAYTNRNEVQAKPQTLEIKAHKHRIPANSMADIEHSIMAGRWLKQLEKQRPIDLVWRMQPLGESCPMIPYTNGRPLVLGQLFYAWPPESVAPNDAGKPRFGFGIRNIVSPLANRGWARTLKAASLVLCTTDRLSEQTRAKTNGRVSTLPVIVDPPINLIPDRARPISNGSLKLLFVANLFRNKNPLVFCQTIHRLRNMGVNASGDILGDGPEREMMQKWCADNGVADHIRFLGRVSNLEVYRHLSEADGLISTSLGEPYGRSIVEAMSVSAVPICHRSGGPADIIRHGVDGLLVDRLDGNDYAFEIHKIFTVPGAWQRLSSAARIQSLNWKPAAVIDRLEEALYSVLEKAGDR